MKLRYAFYLCLIAFSTTLGAQATDLNRFKDPEGITADPTGLHRDTSVRAFPRYPRGMLAKGISGAPVVAFVIDTTGRVELETASFVKTSRPEFAKAVCDCCRNSGSSPSWSAIKSGECSWSSRSRSTLG